MEMTGVVPGARNAPELRTTDRRATRSLYLVGYSNDQSLRRHRVPDVSAGDLHHHCGVNWVEQASFPATFTSTFTA